MATLTKKQTGNIKIKDKWCKGCGICTGICPHNVLALNENGKAYVKNPDHCTGCHNCEIFCPDFAIFLED